MLVKDQLKSRMDQLEITVTSFAKVLSVSDQTVRYWLTGRNIPGRRYRAQIEALLSCSINWSESPRSVDRPSASSLLEQADIEVMLKLSRLSMPVKILFGKLADAIVDDQAVAHFSERKSVSPKKAFSEKATEVKTHAKARSSRTNKKVA